MRNARIILLSLLAFGITLNNSQATILAQEFFDISTGTLHNQDGTTATGWYGPTNWQNQNNYTGLDGYIVDNTTMMTYPGYTTTGNYVNGGHDFETTGRYLDAQASGPFDAHRDGNGRIGTGTVFLSFLIRKENVDDEEVLVVLCDDTGSGYARNADLIKMGYFGTASNVSGSRYWSLSVDDDATVDLSDSTITTGSTYYLVIKIEFAATSTISMWVNPPYVAASLPATPDAQVTTTADIGFWNLVFWADGTGTDAGALDEIIFSDDEDDLLPVEFGEFTYTEEVHDIALHWMTITETNNDFFVIERSLDGSTWEEIDYVPGHGTSTKPISYDYEDYDAPPGEIYYRLKQVDYDGNESYSHIIGIHRHEGVVRVRIYPNPTNGDINVEIDGDAQINTVDLKDLEGHLIAHLNKGTLVGQSELHYHNDHLKSGIYLIQVLTDDHEYVQKVLVESQ